MHFKYIKCKRSCWCRCLVWCCECEFRVLYLSLTSSVALAEIREPPDVPQPHAEAHAGQHVLGFVVPLRPLSSLLQLQLLQLGVRRDPLVQTRVRELQLQLHVVWQVLFRSVLLREVLEIVWDVLIVTGIWLLKTFSTRPSVPGLLKCFVSKIKAGWQPELCWCWLMCNVHSRLGYFWLSDAQSILSVGFIYSYSVAFRELSISFVF